MKKALVVLALATLAGAASAQSVGAPRSVRLPSHDAWMKEMEVGGTAVVHAPGLGDFDVFDTAFGVEFDYRYWFSDVLGVGVGLGVENWTVQEDSRNWVGTLDGDMMVIPLCLTGYLRVADFGWGLLTGFVGFEYAVTDSDVTMSRDGATETVEMDDSINGRIGAELTMPLNDVLSFGVSAGYQTALMMGGAEAFGDGNMEVDMQSLFIGIGASIAF